MPEPFERSRRHRRVPVHVPVRVSTIDPETDPRTGRPYFRDTREYAANLSRGGAFIRTNDPPQTGRRVLVQIHLPDDEPIEAIGRIAWSRQVLTPTGTIGNEGAGRVEGEDAGTVEAGAGIEFLDERLRDEIDRALDLREDDS